MDNPWMTIREVADNVGISFGYVNRFFFMLWVWDVCLQICPSFVESDNIFLLIVEFQPKTVANQHCLGVAELSQWWFRS